MQWSNNSLLKSVEIDKSTAPKSIVTQLPVTPLKKEGIVANKKRSKIVNEKLHKEQVIIESMKEEILGQANQTAETLVEEARVQAELLKQNAMQEIEELKKIAEEKGYQDGQQVGHLQGLDQARIEVEEIFQQARASYGEAIQTSEAYLKEKRHEIVRSSIEIAQALIQTQFEMDKKTILAIVEPILLKMEKPEQLIIIRANPSHYDVLSEKMEQKKQEIPTLRYLVLKNAAKGIQDFSVESDEMLATFELEEELDRFLNQLLKE